MNRLEFLQKGIGFIGIPSVLLAACRKDTTTVDGTSTGNNNCTSTQSETEGPFPTKSPAKFVLTDIRSDRTGVPLTIKINIQNKNASCVGLVGAIVDIWHCDKDGYYSEYGGSGIQAKDFTSVDFLRGRQTTDANGTVGFTSIYPGWYSGRAPHLHVHVYNAAGVSLLVTQIVFPTETSNTVYTTATNFYTKGTQDTSNASDNVFAGNLTTLTPVVTGSVAAGYVLTHNVVVSG